MMAAKVFSCVRAFFCLESSFRAFNWAQNTEHTDIRYKYIQGFDDVQLTLCLPGVHCHIWPLFSYVSVWKSSARYCSSKWRCACRRPLRALLPGCVSTVHCPSAPLPVTKVCRECFRLLDASRRSVCSDQSHRKAFWVSGIWKCTRQSEVCTGQQGYCWLYWDSVTESKREGGAERGRFLQTQGKNR